MKPVLWSLTLLTLLVGCGSKQEETKMINDTRGEGQHTISFTDTESMVIESRFENPPPAAAAVSLYQLAYDDAHSNIISDREEGKGTVRPDGTFQLFLRKIENGYGGFYMANPAGACGGTYTENILNVAYHTVINFRVNGKSYVVEVSTDNPFNTTARIGKKDYQWVFATEETQLKASWDCKLNSATSHVEIDTILKPGWNILEKEYLNLDTQNQKASYMVRRVALLPRDARFYIMP